MYVVQIGGKKGKYFWYMCIHVWGSLRIYSFCYTCTGTYKSQQKSMKCEKKLNVMKYWTHEYQNRLNNIPNLNQIPILKHVDVQQYTMLVNSWNEVLSYPFGHHFKVNVLGALNLF